MLASTNQWRQTDCQRAWAGESKQWNALCYKVWFSDPAYLKHISNIFRHDEFTTSSSPPLNIVFLSHHDETLKPKPKPVVFASVQQRE